MAQNRRSDGREIDVVAGAARTRGVPIVEQNLHGIPEVDAASGARYALGIEGVFEITFIASSVKGDRVDITNADNTLVRVAYGGAVAAGKRPLATVVAVPADGPTADATKAPKTGKMWVKLLPQNVVQA
jgi:hypothetical protein